jgi:hypothetical protein
VTADFFDEIWIAPDVGERYIDRDLRGTKALASIQSPPQLQGVFSRVGYCAHAGRGILERRCNFELVSHVTLL